MTAHWRLKLIVAPAIATVFFVLYFLLLHHPVFPVREMPVTDFDRVVPFEPWSLALYASAAVFILIPPWLLHRKRDLLICCATVAGLCLSGLVVFFFWPTYLDLPPLDHVRYPVFSALMSLDEPRNVCPSEHAAFAVFTAICINRLAPGLGSRVAVRVIGWLWCVGILYSTLATRQHVVFDLFAGALLGTVWAGIFLWATSGEDLKDIVTGK